MCPFLRKHLHMATCKPCKNPSNCKCYKNAKKLLTNRRQIHQHRYTDPRPKEQPEKFRKCHSPMQRILARQCDVLSFLKQSGIPSSLIFLANVFSHSLVRSQIISSEQNFTAKKYEGMLRVLLANFARSGPSHDFPDYVSARKIFI